MKLKFPVFLSNNYKDIRAFEYRISERKKDLQFSVKPQSLRLALGSVSAQQHSTQTKLNMIYSTSTSITSTDRTPYQSQYHQIFYDKFGKKTLKYLFLFRCQKVTHYFYFIFTFSPQNSE